MSLDNTAVEGTEAKTTIINEGFAGSPDYEGGLFAETLKRNNSKIRKDRADAIGEDAELIYKRTIEDGQVKLKQLRREASNLLDLSPENATSLRLASDFDAKSWVEADMKIGLRIRDEEIKLEIAKTRYQVLFGAL